MNDSNSKKQQAPVDMSAADNQVGSPGIGSRIAPAVALLLLGDSAYAIDSTDDDGAHIPEPSVLALLAAGAVVGGAAKYVHNKRRKK